MNPLRGEAIAQAGDQQLKLTLDNNAWVEIEEVLDISYLDILLQLAQGEIAGRSPKNRLMRAILWGATREHHPELTLSGCGDLLMQYPSLHDPISEAIVRSSRSEEPVEPGEAEPAKAPAKKPRKPKASPEA